LVAQGRSSSDIAQVRGTNVRTVHYVIARSLERMGIDPSSEIATRQLEITRFLRASGPIDVVS
jgi:DNA-binding NarL/FixJ family response regulator